MMMSLDGVGTRECFRPPIAEVAEAASLLDRAVSAHLERRYTEAAYFIARADLPEVAAWTESILGKRSTYAIVTPLPASTIVARVPVRMPNALERRQLHERDGYHCRFCGIPVIRPEIRMKMQRAYPKALRWGKRNAERHAAFFAMWVQYDHLVPHSRGGTNSLDNLLVTCSACNYGRGGFMLSEVGLSNPFERPVLKSTWDGLERFASRPG